MKKKTVLNTVFEPLNIINEKVFLCKRYDYAKKKLNHCDENIILYKKKQFLN